jgi:hypothetical protein
VPGPAPAAAADSKSDAPATTTKADTPAPAAVEKADAPAASSDSSSSSTAASDAPGPAPAAANEAKSDAPAAATTAAAPVQVVQLAPGAVAEDDINPNGAWERGRCCVTVAIVNINSLQSAAACVDAGSLHSQPCTSSTAVAICGLGQQPVVAQLMCPALLLCLWLWFAGACKDEIAAQCQDIDVGEGQVAECLSQIAQAAEFGEDAGEWCLQDSRSISCKLVRNIPRVCIHASRQQTHVADVGTSKAAEFAEDAGECRSAGQPQQVLQASKQCMQSTQHRLCCPGQTGVLY